MATELARALVHALQTQTAAIQRGTVEAASVVQDRQHRVVAVEFQMDGHSIGIGVFQSVVERLGGNVIQSLLNRSRQHDRLIYQQPRLDIGASFD